MRPLFNLPARFFFVLLFFYSVSVQGQIKDTSVYQYQVPGSNTWTNSYMGVVTYNTDCQYSNLERYSWNSTTAAWEMSVKTTFSYTTEGVLYQELDQQWNSLSGDWQNSSLTTYMTSENTTTRTAANWNTTDNQWHNVERTIDSTDQNGNVIKRDSWLATDDVLQLVSRTKYLYNEEQQIIGESSYQISNGIYNKSKYHYTNNDLSIEVKGLYRFNEQDPWQNSTKDFTNLLPATKLESFHLLKTYTDGKWYNVYRDSFTYTNNNQLSNAYHEYWNFYVDSGWKKFYREQQDYYKDGSLHHAYSIPWGENPYGNYGSKVTYTHHGCMLQLQAITDEEHAGFTSALRRDGNKYIFDALPVKYSKNKSIVPHYMLTTRKAALQATVSSNAVAVIGFTVYPNPAKDYVQLHVTDPSLRNAHIMLTDISGKTVYSGLYNNSTQKILLPKLAPGIYLLHLQSTNKTITKKLLIK
jgi:hypothetical protein